jgi:Flp pilus assembly protein protease CpaA
MDLVLFALVVPVCIADLSTFVIPNIYTKILSYAALIHLVLHGFGEVTELSIFLGILVFLLILGTGMGDIKLLALIMVTHNLSATVFIAYVIFVAMVHIVVLTAINRAIPAKLPLAPSIFVGLISYLAAR